MHTVSASSSAVVIRHPRWTIAAHWFSALAIVFAFSVVWLRECVDGDALRALMLTVHRQFGLLVLLLWGVRLLVRWRTRAQAVPADTTLPLLLRWGAAASHGVLYLVLLAMPLLGWAMTNAQGHDVLWLNLLPLPHLTATDPDMADTLQEWHGRAAWALLTLVAMHAVAALWHHLMRRDGVLAAMLPLVQPRSARAPQN